MIKNLIKIHIRYKENEFGKLKGNLKEFQEKYRERKNIKIVYIHSVEEQVYNIGLTSYSIVNNNVLNSLKKEILDWNFGIVEYTQCDDITQTSKFIFKEIDCNQPLIFKILERSKDFYEKQWKVDLDLNSDKELIRIGSLYKDPLVRLDSSINVMIKKLIKINIRYKENEFVKLKQHIWVIQKSIEKEKISK